jgi:hypothetical protein
MENNTHVLSANRKLIISAARKSMTNMNTITHTYPRACTHTYACIQTYEHTNAHKPHAYTSNSAQKPEENPAVHESPRGPTLSSTRAWLATERSNDVPMDAHRPGRLRNERDKQRDERHVGTKQLPRAAAPRAD